MDKYMPNEEYQFDSAKIKLHERVDRAMNNLLGRMQQDGRIKLSTYIALAKLRTSDLAEFVKSLDEVEKPQPLSGHNWESRLAEGIDKLIKVIDEKILQPKDVLEEWKQTGQMFYRWEEPSNYKRERKAWAKMESMLRQFCVTWIGGKIGRPPSELIEELRKMFVVQERGNTTAEKKEPKYPGYENFMNNGPPSGGYNVPHFMNDRHWALHEYHNARRQEAKNREETGKWYKMEDVLAQEQWRKDKQSGTRPAQTPEPDTVKVELSQQQHWEIVEGIHLLSETSKKFIDRMLKEYVITPRPAHATERDTGWYQKQAEKAADEMRKGMAEHVMQDSPRGFTGFTVDNMEADFVTRYLEKIKRCEQELLADYTAHMEGIIKSIHDTQPQAPQPNESKNQPG